MLQTLTSRMLSWKTGKRCCFQFPLNRASICLHRPGGGSWRSVNHSAREFSRAEDGVTVSNNAVEGLFGRLKRHNRLVGVRCTRKKNYGWMLGEFLWREKCLSGHDTDGTHSYCLLVLHRFQRLSAQVWKHLGKAQPSFNSVAFLVKQLTY